MYIYICICVSSGKPTDSIAHDCLWSLITNTQLTNSHKIFEGALFHLTKKSTTRFTSTICFYLLSRTCDANFIHNVSLPLHLTHSSRSNINLTPSGCSLSTLPIHTFYK